MVETSPTSQVPEASILGYNVSLLNQGDTLRLLEQWVHEKRPRLVITVDATGVMIARKNPKFSKMLENADLRTADGAGLIWALKRKGVVANKVSGVDLVDKITALSAEKGYRIYFLGAAPEVAALAAEKMRLRHPGCNIVGARDGFFPASDFRKVAEEVAVTKPDFLFVAMGMPRQEEFILETQDIIQAPVAMGVGGSFDVFSGKTKRAPTWMQKVHLEWLWRLMLNPTKIQKVKELPKFAVTVLREGNR
jgi:N-acetylglucosaminyldiphosphoundecaprenol N-acetyl-beta-D-mannosaminyltransferase